MTMLSVIIPVYNAAEYLHECLDSIFKQDMTSLEVICIDDCSTDSSVEVIQGYIDKGLPVRLFRNETNRHAGVCRNIGLEKACGEWLHFMDADDKVMPGAYARFIAIAERYELDMVRGNGIAANNAYLHRSVSPVLSWRNCSFARDGAELLKLSVVPWLGIVRRQFVQENNLRFSDLFCGNDVTFFMQSILLARRIRLLRQPLVWHRVNLAKSLVGRRAEHYTCDFENYRLIEASSRSCPLAARALVLSRLLEGLCNWLARHKQQAPEKWPEIRSYAVAFFRQLDRSPWQGRERAQRWYRDAYRLFGKELFADCPTQYWRIILLRLEKIAYGSVNLIAGCFNVKGRS